MSAKLLTESTTSDFAKSGMPLANSTNAPLPMLRVRIRQSLERSKDGEGGLETSGLGLRDTGINLP